MKNVLNFLLINDSLLDQHEPNYISCIYYNFVFRLTFPSTILRRPLYNSAVNKNSYGDVNSNDLPFCVHFVYFALNAHKILISCTCCFHWRDGCCTVESLYLTYILPN
jgi:hypothetical protein